MSPIPGTTNGKSERYRTRKKRNQRRKKRLENSAKRNLTVLLNESRDQVAEETEERETVLLNESRDQVAEETEERETVLLHESRDQVAEETEEREVSIITSSEMQQERFGSILQKPPGYKFVWTNRDQQKHQQRKKKEQSSSERLREDLECMKDEYLLLHSRHKHCTHERMSKLVSVRTSMIVEAAVLSDSYSKHQWQLDGIPLQCVFDEEGVDFYRNKRVLYDRGNCKVYYHDGLVFKEYNLMHGMAAHEYRVSTALKELKVNFVAEAHGIVKLAHRVSHLLVMKYYGIDGCHTSVERLIYGQLHSIKASDWVKVAWSLCMFVSSLHSAGYIHNKIHTENVIVSNTNGCLMGVVCDMQYCCLATLSKPLTITQQSKLAHNLFVAPELSLNKPPTYATDVFSLGSVINYMTCHTSLPNMFRKVAMACMEANPSQRISAIAALRWFEEDVGHLGWDIEKPSWPVALKGCSDSQLNA